MPLPLRCAALPPLRVDEAVPAVSCAAVEQGPQLAEEGAYLWVQVACEQLPARQAAAALARTAQVDEHLVCGAGSHDRRAHYTAWFSIPADQVEHPAAIPGAGYKRKLRVLAVQRFRRPVSAQEIKNLQWTLRVNGGAGLYQEARRLLDHLRREPAPNYMAATVIGTDNEARWGRLLAQGRSLPPAVARQGLSARRLLGASRGRLFNRLVAERLGRDLLRHALVGDVLRTGCNGRRQGEEILTEEGAADARIASGEAVITGPLFGEGLVAASGPAAALEDAVLAQAGLRPEGFASLRGQRRALSYRPTQVVIDLDRRDLLITCCLPPEVHIATLVDELLAPRSQMGPEDEEWA